MPLFYRWALALLAPLLITLASATGAWAQIVKLDRFCGPGPLFASGQLLAVPWVAADGNIVKVPIHTPCWLRLTRPAATDISGAPDNQFLRIENSWGSDFSVYMPNGALYAKFTMAGERYRTLGEKIRIFVSLGTDTPEVLYAKVEPHNNFVEARHSVRQLDGNAVVTQQRAQVRPAATGWFLFGAGVFGLLFFIFQRSREYALFSLFAFTFALTMFADNGELNVFGVSASSDFLSLAYPLSGALLAWLALQVGRFSRFTPWVAYAIWVVVVLYASVAAWQVLMMAGLPLSTADFGRYADVVYNVSALLQVFVFWAGFAAWRRGDRVGLLLAIGIAPLILFEIQISDWLAAVAPGLAATVGQALGSSLRALSYVLLPLMFVAAIAYRARNVQLDAIRLARHDHLTNLPNRDHFLLLGQKLLAQSQRSVLLAINIDRLKAINDVLGFQVGDAVIVEVGRRLSGLGANLVSRVQTSEFCVLVELHNLPSVRRMLDEVFSKPITVLEQTLDVSLSIGLANHNGEAIELLLRDAEIALGVAKNTKVNWLAYEAAMDTTRPESLSLVSDLSRAIAQNELQLFLQPKVRLADGAVLGAEGLLRWQHPTRGMVPPNHFIPFAEQTGKIIALTLWVAKEAAKFVAACRAQHRPLVVSINISTFDLRDPYFVERIVRIVNEAGAHPADLRLEVTESGMMDDPETSLKVLHALRDAGFSLSIDDFGTGYSSLSYLQRMPVQELKIDRSFVTRVHIGSEGAALLDSIIALGHRMGLSVVAEGAETLEECGLLRSLGCDFVQGWFVAKAMPQQEFEHWRTTHVNFNLGL